VRVLERRATLSAASRASTFHPPTLDALEELGVLAPLLPGGVRVDRILWRQVATGASASLDLGILAAEDRLPLPLAPGATGCDAGAAGGAARGLRPLQRRRHGAVAG
jgi:hypothetical protein